MKLKDWITPEEAHINMANDIGDKIYSLKDCSNAQMLEYIRQRLIKLTQNSLNDLRKFNK